MKKLLLALTLALFWTGAAADPGKFPVASANIKWGTSPGNEPLVLSDPPTSGEGPEVQVAEDHPTTIEVDLTEYFDDDGGDENLTYSLGEVNHEGEIANVSITGSTLSFDVVADKFGFVSIDVEAVDADMQSVEGGVAINITPVADTPTVDPVNGQYLTNTYFTINRNPADGSEVSHVKVTNINNGALYTQDLATQILEGDFVNMNSTGSQLVFRPTVLGEVHLNIQAATGGEEHLLGGDVVQVTFDIGPADLSLQMHAPSEIPFGTPLAEEHFNATATVGEVPVEGTFEYEPSLGTILGPGTHVFSVSFIPDDVDNFNPVSGVQSNVAVVGETRMIGMGGFGGGQIFRYVRGQDSFEHVATMSVPDAPVYSNLIEGMDGKLWAMSSSGGVFENGCIFRVSDEGNVQVVFSFNNADGDGNSPKGSLLVHDGKYWGMTAFGGTNDGGVIFSIDADGQNYTVVHNFGGAAPDGKWPNGSLIESDGKLWGMTKDGGASGNGTIFSYDADAETYSTVHSFSGAAGGEPYGDLLKSNGKFWGMTYGGGAAGDGTIFSLNLDGTGFSAFHSFSDGEAPYGSLIAFDGLLWGMTDGGTNGYGQVIMVNPNDNDVSTFHNFTGDEASSPTGNLVVANGQMWGMTQGNYLFTFSGGGIQIKHEFTSATGRTPLGSLKHKDGKLWGLLYAGDGTFGSGGVFQYDISGEVYHGYGFSSSGRTPNGELLRYNNRFYGTTQRGGAHDKGTIFSMNLDGTGLTTIHHFDGTDGYMPVRGLTQNTYNDGVLWGVTIEGGEHGFGTIFSISPAGENFTVRHEFNDTNGKYPDAKLTLDLAYGVLYGSTTRGGAGSNGVIFSYNISNDEFEVLRSLEPNDGTWPVGTLILSYGYLFGVTNSGGANGKGTLFRLETYNQQMTVLHAFTNDDGTNPQSGLALVNGHLWGTTGLGGGSGKSGSVFRFTGTFEVMHRFPTTGPHSPSGELTLIDGRLWGTTGTGGSANRGGLYNLLYNGPDYDFQDAAQFTNLDGAEHNYARMFALGTPPWATAASPIVLDEDQGFTGVAVDGFFEDAEDYYGAMTYAVLNNSNPELFQEIEINNESAGIFFSVPANQFGSGEFLVRATDQSGASVVNTVPIVVRPMGDKPSGTEATAFVGQFNTEGLVVTRNPVDGEECEYFQVFQIFGDVRLYYNDETTEIEEGDFVPYSEGALGLKIKSDQETFGYIRVKGAVEADPETVSQDWTTMDINVSKQTPVMTWTEEVVIYGTWGAPLGEEQLFATVNAPGTIEYRYGLYGSSEESVYQGEILEPGFYVVVATFIPDNPNLYHTAQMGKYLVVEPQLPVITWPTPAPISPGTPLSELQLNATVDVEGTLVYSHNLGDVLPIGTHQLSVDLTDFDTEHYYSPGTKTVYLVVEQPQAHITWATPAPIPYGTPLSELQLNATVDIDGTLVYSHSIGDVLDIGTHYLTVELTDFDAAYAQPDPVTVELVVEPAEVEITWPTPAPIMYGTPLGDQLNATASVSGVYTFSHNFGDILDAGTYTLTVLFIPDNPTHAEASASVELVVQKAIPVVIWTVPASVPWGTTISPATASVAGDFDYPISITGLLEIGSYTITAEFTPFDADNYETVSIPASFNVVRANPELFWAPITIQVGTALASSHFNASSNTGGTFTYSESVGALFAAGTHTLTANFTPSDPDHFANGSVTTQLTVLKINPVVSWNTPADIVYGTALSSTQLNATADVAGVFTYQPAPGAVLDAGSQTLTAVFQPVNVANYSTITTTVVLSVAKANQSITFSAPANVTVGDAPLTLTGTSTSGLTVAFASSDQTRLSISGSTATVLAAGSVTLTASQAGNGNYNAAANVEQTFCIRPARPTITVNNSNPEAPVLTSSSDTGNQWFLNGTAVSGATGKTITVAAGGEYTVQVTVGGCASQQSVSSKFIVTAAWVETSEPSMRVYPNPVVDELHVTWTAGKGESRVIVVFDILGRVMEQRQMDSDELVLDVKAFAGGNYLVVGTQGAAKFQRRFVKH